MLALLAVVVIVLACFFMFKGRATDSPANNSTGRSDATTAEEKQGSGDTQKAATKQATFDKKQHSTDEPNSPWVIANKRRPLNPKEFAPELGTPDVPLRLAAGAQEMMMSTQAIPSLEAMFDAAKGQGINLMVASAYRSYGLQVGVYGNEVKNYGQAEADRQSARPGHSEHQTGLAVDIEPVSRQCEVEDCFGDTPEGKWAAANAHSYGFVLRYMPGGEAVTGYRHETWHFRYVGKELAEEIHRQGNPPLETFFGLGAAPDYQ